MPNGTESINRNVSIRCDAFLAGSIRSSVQPSSTTAPSKYSEDSAVARLETDELADELESVESALLRVQPASHALSFRRDAIKAILQGRGINVVPASRLPSELLLEIFLYGRTVTLMCDREHGVERVVSQVCRRWRDAALGSPRLWTELFLPRADDRRLGLPWLRNAVIPRSTNLPLNIMAELGPGTPHTESLLNAIASVANRWKTITLWLTVDQLIYMMTSINSMAALEEIYIEFFPDHRLDLVEAPLNGFAAAPSLRRVHLGHGPSLQLNLPWRQLEQLHCPFKSWDTYSAVLPLSTNLQAHTVWLDELFGWQGASPEVIPVFELTSLRKLAINHYNTALPHSYLERVTLPGLEDLCIKSYSDQIGDIAHHLLRHSQRSGNHLRRLELHFTTIPVESLITLLGETPSISDLALYELALRPSYSDFFTLLSKYNQPRSSDTRTGAAHILPMLTSLLISFAFSCEFSINAQADFVTFVESRQGDVTCDTYLDAGHQGRLETLALHVPAGRLPVLREYIEKWATNGFNVHLEPKDRF